MKEDIQLAETYFRDLTEIHQSGAGVKEESYYGSLEKLLNAVGKGLKPRIRCIIQLQNRGAGEPDGGLFIREQYEHGSETEPLLGQTPARGVIEVKSTVDDAWVTADSHQVSKYWKKYHLVMVTNYRDFLLVGKDKTGNPVKLESYRLGTSEQDFWQQAAHPKTLAREQGETLIEYLRRSMLHSAAISSAEELAWFLASYARTASARIEKKEVPALESVRSALEAALGLKFEGEKGEHFFRSTLVQTVFYGLFSAWVLWSKKRSNTGPDVFDWHNALWELKVPVMQALFGQIVTPAHVGNLDLEDTLDWATSTLNRVDRSSFFSAFEDGQAVQYFYEPFLDAFDPELRKELGVWYTPHEIVQYMVARVDTVLKEELDIPDGLANPNVFILDPCCGTGSYLIEVLKRIYQTIKLKGPDALSADEVKQAALKRVFGFEILPAPFVVSHMQLGLLLQNLGAPLSDTNHERAAVYLTNALTGWEPLEPEKEKAFQGMLTGFPQLLEEQADASKVKQQVPILVILGNPPYNAFAGTAPTKEEQDSVGVYKEGLVKEWSIKKFNLDDLYVRFFRMAERRIAEQTGRGVICLISSFSFLSDPSFVVMRQRLITEFDRLWFDNLNGDSRETGKRTPDGKPDPSVFSTEYNKAGIRVGTTVSTLVRKEKRDSEAVARYRELWGAAKRIELLDSLKANDFGSQYQIVGTRQDNRYSFRPGFTSSEYNGWPQVIDFCTTQPFNGPIERRSSSLIRMRSDKEAFAVLESYLDPEVDDDEIIDLEPRFFESSGEFEAAKTRAALKGKIKYDAARIVLYPFKPFDIRMAYLDPDIAPLFSRPAPRLLAQQDIVGNAFFLTRDSADKDEGGPPFYFSRCVCDYDCVSGHARHFPVFVRSVAVKGEPNPATQAHFLDQVKEGSSPPIANLSTGVRDYLARVGVDNPDSDSHNARIIWMHALAIGYSPAYLSENADGIRSNWPRIPLPNNGEHLYMSARLGERIAALLDTEAPVAGITSAPFRPEIAGFGVVSREGGGNLKLPDDLRVTAGWGHADTKGTVMPGKGKIVRRDYSTEEKQAILEGAQDLAIAAEKALELLGDRTLDIYLNDNAYWKNVPEKVWDYFIGGYQVVKKWLSYRERAIIGRPLTTDEAREVTGMVRRIAAIILLQPALDANYQQCKSNAYEWPKA